MLKRLPLLLSVVITAVFVMTGCGSDSDSGGSGPVVTGPDPDTDRVVFAGNLSDTIDFESIETGAIVMQAFGNMGTGPVLIRGVNPALGDAVNAAIVFDSAAPGPYDPDLGTPNGDYGGPGQGTGGEEGADFPNDVAQGHLLIVADNLTDDDDDGLVDLPNDTATPDATLIFDFSRVQGGTVAMQSLVVIDIEAVETPAEVTLLGPEGVVLAVIPLPAVGDNGRGIVDLGGTMGVQQMLVHLRGSGAIDDIEFSTFDSTGNVGDFVYCDLDDDGVQDDGEPGIPGAVINLHSGGADGQLDTPDDIFLTTTTDESGTYLFVGVPAGPVVVEIDPDSVPDKIPGRCFTSLKIRLAPNVSYLDADFCMVEEDDPEPQFGAIGDFVYCDLNDNGVPDAGEPGIGGVTVNLTCAGPDEEFDTPDDLQATTVTGPRGRYAFDEIPPGLCRVEVDPSTAGDDKIPGECPLEQIVEVAPLVFYDDADFCFVEAIEPEPGSIGDLVFLDSNGNGAHDEGEPGVTGVTVILTGAGPDGDFDTADDTNDSVETDSEGGYLFDLLPAGSYKAELDTSTIPEGLEPGLCPLLFEIDLAEGQAYLDADFCLVETPEPEPGSIGDLVFLDSNGNGAHDEGEPGVTGVTVILTGAGPDGDFDTADDTTDSVETDSEGGYLFDLLPAGSYKAVLDTSTIPEGLEPGLCPLLFEIGLAEGQAYLDADFCLVETPEPEPGSIGDLVFLDSNGNGVHDEGEPGVAGVTVILTGAGPDGDFDTGDDTTDSVETDSEGGYLFDLLPAGSYKAELDTSTIPEGLEPGPCPLLFEIDLAEGQAYLDADFCLVETPEPELGSIGDFVYFDTDDNGSPSPDEPGLAGVVVHLSSAGLDQLWGTVDDLEASTATGADGYYLFEDIPAGPAEVTVDPATAPTGTVMGICPGSVGLNLGEGETFLDADFCFVGCLECTGGVRSLTLRFIGGGSRHNLTVKQADGTEVFVGTINAGEVFSFDGAMDDGTFGGEVRLRIQGGPECKIDTSCERPIGPGLVAGEFEVIDAIAHNGAPLCEVIPEPCDDLICSLDLRYVGGNCDDSSNSQADGDWDCGGMGTSAPSVYIVVNDSSNPEAGHIWFRGPVAMDETFTAASWRGHEFVLGVRTYVHVYNEQGGSLRQSIFFDTSCRTAVSTGDVFGVLEVIGSTAEGTCGPENAPGPGPCPTPNPGGLLLKYSGEDCSASDHHQCIRHTKCEGDPGDEPMVWIVVNDMLNPNSGTIWFAGWVELNEVFSVTAATAGQPALHEMTYVHIMTDPAATMCLQVIGFATSCYGPLEEGDQFGSIVVVEILP